MSTKKASKSEKESATYETRDIVLGKVRGYPPWPGMVVDPDSVPPLVRKERPTTKKTQFYCVRFFPTGDFAWLVAKDISKLQNREIQSYINEPNKKSGDLLQGYRIALDPTKWEEEREAESRLAAEEEANAEVDELESDADASDDESSGPRKSRKRKRDSDPSISKAKKVHKKRDMADPKRKSASAPGKGKKNGRKANATIESEEEDGDQTAAGDPDAGPSSKGSAPPAKRQKHNKGDDADDAKGSTDPEATKVKDWRHKLQKTFLSSKGIPKDEEMPAIDHLFTTVENYDKLTIEYLQFSKIGKVMRHIAVLEDEKIPRNAEFKFKERADALVKKWQQILNANKSANASIDSISALAPLSAAPGMKDDDTTVTQATAAINLNGKLAEDAGDPALAVPVDDVPMTDAA
ncbi:hypothetical protein AGABI1DRAFT_116494 [Agaricus bisporus var. burnettii JB137-S8]|uniref:PWWP domain-containing protein n=1 Tax=Agaricus bisporus var. burnettii (strain JB137-S8 / ATCC MYA-4627 / FGSC 10392) TaxID=597362 RepID=K5VLL8_AGABU|nr:uncharacterized protein AGABI1DRAFT_116494 [Agaricus bisporus var. burnettii JB137-S8]EKM75299.1 hypothetical protein AGABI1DRAFT_116494 [Agaricus bisporus var. burnettii JB137-S8]